MACVGTCECDHMLFIDRPAPYESLHEFIVAQTSVIIFSDLYAFV